MSCVFQNIDPPPPPPPPGECVLCVYPPPLLRGEDTLAGWKGGWGVKILEEARHSSVLYLYRILFGGGGGGGERPPPFTVFTITNKVVVYGGNGPV
jgi:hypothetical protein